MVTTPIFYVNSSPHLGHLYSCLLADAHCRFIKLNSQESRSVIFSTGTDEHGLKVQQAAAKENLLPGVFVDRVSSQFRTLFDFCDIEYTKFARTSTEEHKDVVGKVWRRLEKSGGLYKTEYSGWYSVQEEAFIPSTQVEEKNGSHFSTETGQQLEWAEETNWMFRLGKFRENLLSWHNEKLPVCPAQFRGQVHSWLSDSEMPDLSISRPSSRLHWGVQVPGDVDQTIYVWVDALASYLTVSNYPTMESWPPTVQVLGKDILKFHAVYWPAILMCLDLPLPRKLLVHSHWTIDQVKMSKSLGNVVDPTLLVNKYTLDGVRYFLLREGVPHSDGNFSESYLVQLLNLELADTLGNLLNRSTSKGVNKKQFIPQYPPKLLFESPTYTDLVKQLIDLSLRVGDLYDSFHFYQGIVQVMAALRLTNQLVQEQEPWRLKGEDDAEKLEWVLSITFETLRISGILLQPVVPHLAGTLLDKLMVGKKERGWDMAKLGRRKFGGNIKEGKTVLFNKIKQ